MQHAMPNKHYMRLVYNNPVFEISFETSQSESHLHSLKIIFPINLIVNLSDGF